MLEIKIETIEELEKAEAVSGKIQNLGNIIKRSTGAKAFKEFVEGMKKIYNDIDPDYFDKQYNIDNDGGKIVISEVIRDSFELTKKLNEAMDEFNKGIVGIVDEYTDRNIKG